jgi:hypothetical protein
MKNPKLILLPGLAADFRIFKHQLTTFSESIVVDWIDPKLHETLEEYAFRLTRSMAQVHGQVICGISFGGILAPYVAKHLHSSSCILFSTIRSPKEFPKWFFPIWILDKKLPFLLWIAILFAKVMAKFLLCFSFFWKRIVDPDLIRQIADSHTINTTRFFRMLLVWAYASKDKNTQEEFPFPIVHVHGSHDFVLPYFLTKPDVLIRYGGHVLVMSHPLQSNEIIKKMLIMAD